MPMIYEFLSPFLRTPPSFLSLSKKTKHLTTYDVKLVERICMYKLTCA